MAKKLTKATIEYKNFIHRLYNFKGVKSASETVFVVEYLFTHEKQLQKGCKKEGFHKDFHLKKIAKACWLKSDDLVSVILIALEKQGYIQYNMDGSIFLTEKAIKEVTYDVGIKECRWWDRNYQKGRDYTLTHTEHLIVTYLLNVHRGFADEENSIHVSLQKMQKWSACGRTVLLKSLENLKKYGIIDYKIGEPGRLMAFDKVENGVETSYVGGGRTCTQIWILKGNYTLSKEMGEQLGCVKHRFSGYNSNVTNPVEDIAGVVFSTSAEYERGMEAWELHKQALKKFKQNKDKWKAQRIAELAKEREKREEKRNRKKARLSVTGLTV